MTDTLQGERTLLRPLHEDDVPLLARWLFDPDVLPWLQLSEDPPELRTVEAVRERYQRMAADLRTRLWRIDTLDGMPIGHIDLVDIHPLQRRAEVHMAIGEKEYWSGGYGSDALRRLVSYAFTALELRRIYIMADEDNARAIRAYEKAGFVREGLLRAHRIRFGQPVNMLLLGLLREEFR